jgi:hypothetical protein
MIGTVKKLNIEQGTEEQGILNWRTRRIPLTPKGELSAQRFPLTPKGELEGTKNTSIHFTIKPNSKQKSPLGGDLGGGLGGTLLHQRFWRIIKKPPPKRKAVYMKRIFILIIHQA